MCVWFRGSVHQKGGVQGWAHTQDSQGQIQNIFHRCFCWYRSWDLKNVSINQTNWALLEFYAYTKQDGGFTYNTNTKFQQRTCMHQHRKQCKTFLFHFRQTEWQYSTDYWYENGKKNAERYSAKSVLSWLSECIHLYVCLCAFVSSVLSAEKSDSCCNHDLLNAFRLIIWLNTLSSSFAWRHITYI